MLMSMGAAHAACYVDYKAKQDDPLRLLYGVAQINGECSIAAATAEISARLAAAGWQLLDVLDTFDETGLEERRASAGENYLRY